MTNDQIDQLLALEAKATPEPWEAISYYDGSRTVCMMRHQTQICGVAANNESSPWEHYNWNAQLIAAARNSIRPLAEEVLQLRRTVAELRETLLTILPGLVLDLRYASEDDDKDALRSRIQCVREALLGADAPGSEPGASNGIEAIQSPLL